MKTTAYIYYYLLLKFQTNKMFALRGGTWDVCRMRRYFKRNGVPCLVTIDHQVSTTPRRRLGIVYDGITARVDSYQYDNLVIASATTSSILIFKIMCTACTPQISCDFCNIPLNNLNVSFASIHCPEITVTWTRIACIMIGAHISMHEMQPRSILRD